MNDMRLGSVADSLKQRSVRLDSKFPDLSDEQAAETDLAFAPDMLAPSSRQQSQLGGILALMVLSLLLGIGGVLGVQRLETSNEAAAPTSQPRATPTPLGIGALGWVVPATHIRRIGAPSPLAVTRIARLFVHQGDQVKAGQLLAEFADANLKDAEVSEAADKVTEAQAELTLVKDAARPSQIAAQEAHIGGLTAQQQVASLDAARSASLVSSGATARAVADRDRAAADAANANVLQAEEELVTLQHPRPEDVVLAEARLHTAEAALASARAEAALSRIYAPTAGTILAIYARPGDLVGANGLLAMADLHQLDVVADVYQSDLPRVRMGAVAKVIVPGHAQPYTARVVEIGSLVRHTIQAGTDPVARVDGRTVKVRLALLPAETKALRHQIDMQVQVAIQP